MRPPCLAELEAHFATVTGPAVVQASAEHMRAVLAYVAELESRLGIVAGGEAARVAGLLRWPADVGPRAALAPLCPEPWPVVERRAKGAGL